MILDGVTDIRIRGLRLRGNSGLMVADGPTKNVMILDNDMRWEATGGFSVAWRFVDYMATTIFASRITSFTIRPTPIAR